MLVAPTFRGRGLYAITPDELDDARLEAMVARVLQARPALVQYRNKLAPAIQRLRQAKALAALCGAADVPLIINDDPRLALACGAQGVHLGGDDETLPTSRALLGSRAIIGVSCYADIDLARQAQREGANYVAFGSVFGSPTKPGAARVSTATLSAACRELSIPVCAIGGIDHLNASGLLTLGVELIAVISDIFATDDPRAAAAALQRLFDAPPVR